MSLFEDLDYMYQETFFVYLERESRPQVEAMEACLREVDPDCTFENIVKTDEGLFQSASVRFPRDNSALDVVYAEGEAVQQQVGELILELEADSLFEEDLEKARQLGQFDARFDLFQFNEKSLGEDMFDPGGLFLVMEKLGELCGGIGLDPQSQSLI